MRRFSYQRVNELPHFAQSRSSDGVESFALPVIVTVTELPSRGARQRPHVPISSLMVVETQGRTGALTIAPGGEQNGIRSSDGVPLHRVFRTTQVTGVLSRKVSSMGVILGSHKGATVNAHMNEER